MIILSHRGYWKKISEKNTITAFKRSFQLGFGTETDIRDYKGELVISHDIADSSCMNVKLLFEIYNQFDNTLPLALNIKADGLQIALKKLLDEYAIQNYFVFDMSIPDSLGYLKNNMNVFTRQSEYERDPSFYLEANGIWMDEFHNHWISKNTIRDHLKENKQVCIVSPDLHKRDYFSEWEHYKQIESDLNINHLMLCTDYPEIAKTIFKS